MDRTPEELAERQRIHDLLAKTVDQSLWKMVDLVVDKRSDQLLGATEFAVRDAVLQMGASMIEATIDDKKKVNTKAPVSSALTVARTHVSSTGGGEIS